MPSIVTVRALDDKIRVTDFGRVSLYCEGLSRGGVLVRVDCGGPPGGLSNGRAEGRAIIDVVNVLKVGEISLAK